MVGKVSAAEGELVALARTGDAAAFEQLVGRYRTELTAHCYRILGSIHDAEDALQESLLSAWTGLKTFEGRSSVRTWLYRICTHACLRLTQKRQPRLLSPDYTPPLKQTSDLGEFTAGPWLDPWPGDIPAADADPAAAALQREGVELAFVAALQHLPGTQRAVLILREVLAYSAAEVAEMLDTTTVSVNSTLQRARKSIDERVPATSQQAEVAELGSAAERELLDGFLAAWERADIDAIRDLLTEDARMTMPPIPAWFDGRDNVLRFFADRVFATPWRLQPITVNGQLGFAAYIRLEGENEFRWGGVNVLTVRAGRLAAISSFLDPALHETFGLPAMLPEELEGVERK